MKRNIIHRARRVVQHRGLNPALNPNRTQVQGGPTPTTVCLGLGTVVLL